MKINGSRLEKNDIRPARKFENEFKFLDDLTTLNDGREFVTGFKEIKWVLLNLLSRRTI